MYVRLAFAVAAHLEPEILIVDEVLAVGDAQFQKKCLGKMGDVAARAGARSLFVSHNMAAVQRLATSAMLLERGRVVKDSGNVRAMVAQYLSGDSHAAFAAERRTGRPQILEAEVIDERGNRVAKPLNTDRLDSASGSCFPNRAPACRSASAFSRPTAPWSSPATPTMWRRRCRANRASTKRW